MLVVAAASAAACRSADGPSATQPDGGPAAAAAPQVDAPPRLEAELVAFGRALGAVAPCGCTTEPLGGLPFAMGLVEAGDPRARLVVEPGALLYPDPAGPEAPRDAAAWAQADQRAAALHTQFAQLGARLVSGLGPSDVASPAGTAALAQHPLPRVAANVRAPAGGEDAWKAHAIVPLTPVLPGSDGPGEPGAVTLQVGVTAVIDPALAGAAQLGEVVAMAPALREQVAAMRAAGAQLVVVMAHAEREAVEALVREVEGIDVAVVAVNRGPERARLGSPAAEIGGTIVLEPGEQLQTLSRLHLSLDPALTALPPREQWVTAPARAAVEADLARVAERLAALEADPSADPGFLANLRREQATLRAALQPPTTAPVVITLEQLKVTCRGPADADAKVALREYDAWVANANKTRFAGVKPPPPAKGQPGYVGIETCDLCHSEAVEFWNGTKHAGAYETLVAANKQFDLSCVGCHVTGFREPGGSEVVENAGLVDVQCEVCHGPGSLHADQPQVDGKPHAIRREAPEALVCGTCHTPEHSDTFRYDAYLRDILGKGHGPEARAALGDGPTGAQLRAAGLAKAGGACKGM